MRRYQFSDFTGPEKPRIVTKRRHFGDRVVYSYCCSGRATTGWGITPKAAYDAWLHNWRRRYRFYGERQRVADLNIGQHTR